MAIRAQISIAERHHRRADREIPEIGPIGTVHLWVTRA
jgi:hypothetical protein